MSSNQKKFTIVVDDTSKMDQSGSMSKSKREKTALIAHSAREA